MGRVVITIGITIISCIIGKLSSLSATLAVNCINDCVGGLLEVGAVVWDWWEAQISVFSVFLVFTVISFIGVGIIMGKLSLSLLAMLAMGCGSGGGLLRVEAVASDWYVVQILGFLVFSVFSVISIIIRSIITSIIIGKSSLMSLAASAVDCGMGVRRQWHCSGGGTDHHCLSVCSFCGHCYCCHWWLCHCHCHWLHHWCLLLEKCVAVLGVNAGSWSGGLR